MSNVINKEYESNPNKYQSKLSNYALCIVIFSTLVFSSMPMLFLVNRGIFLLWVVIFIVMIAIRKRPIQIPTPYIIMFVWLMFALLPSVFSINPTNSIFKVLTVLQVVIMSLMSYNIILWNGKYKVFFWAFVLSALAAYLVSFTPLSGIQFGDRELGSRMGRTTGTYTNANAFGIMLIQACCVILLLFLNAIKKKEKILLMIMFFVLTVGVVTSGSRTAILGLLLLVAASSLAFNVWSIKKPGRTLAFIISLIFLSGIIVAVTLSNPGVKARYDKFFDVLDSGDLTQSNAGVSIHSRTNLALKAWEAGVQSPFGVGLDNFRATTGGAYAHSNYFEIFASTGILGFFIYYSFYLLVIIAALKLPKKYVNTSERNLLMYIPFILMFLDIFNVSYYNKDIWLLFSFIIAAIEINRKKAKELKMTELDASRVA